MNSQRPANGWLPGSEEASRRRRPRLSRRARCCRREQPGQYSHSSTDGRSSDELLRQWALQRSARDLDQSRTERTLTWSDPRTGLQVRCVAIEYHDFPTVEWTVYFKNTGTSATPIIENIQALELDVLRGANGEFLLHHNIGSPADGNDYGPLETPLGPRATKRIGGAGGRPTNSDWSYFNLAWAGEGRDRGGGLARAVGG